MMAAREGHENLARGLLEAGANPKLQSDWGDSAVTMAMRYDHLRLAKMISSPEEFAIQRNSQLPSRHRRRVLAKRRARLRSRRQSTRFSRRFVLLKPKDGRARNCTRNCARRSMNCGSVRSRWHSGPCHAPMCRARW